MKIQITLNSGIVITLSGEDFYELRRLFCSEERVPPQDTDCVGQTYNYVRPRTIGPVLPLVCDIKSTGSVSPDMDCAPSQKYGY